MNITLPHYPDLSCIKHVIVDSRSLTDAASTLFVALRTPNNDGHSFIPDLLARGVRYFVVEHAPEDAPADARFIVVDDTLDALRLLGREARDNSRAKVVAITGSRGKTIVKEWLWAALSQHYRVSRSPRSWNSQIGVPLSLLMADADADYSLIECGISRCGEMHRLAEIVRPQIGIITAITDEHSDGFESVEQKIDQKLDLFADVDTLIYNADNALLERKVVERYGGRAHLIPVHGGSGNDVADNMAYVRAFINVEHCDADCSGCADYVPSTRLNVIDGVNRCRLTYDRFTADTLSLRGALDFVRRQVAGTQPITLVLATDGFVGTDDEVATAATQYGVKRIIRVSAADNIAERFTTDDFYDEAILLKGSRKVSLDSLYAMLEAKQAETLLEVNLDAVVSNFNFFRSKVRPTTGIVCMLKAGGYGTGSVELARTLQSQGAAYIAVAVVDEGIELRRAGITVPIMVLNPRAQNMRMMFDYRLEPEIYSFDMLERIVAAARRYGVKAFPVHIKLDTGMHRLGFLESDMERLGRYLCESPEVVAASVFSHLACADDPAEDAYTHKQFDIFARCCDILEGLLPERPKRHILNSTGIVRFPQMQYDMVRLGIGLYGVPTLSDGTMSALRNVATLTAPVISLKHWQAGDTIGYNRRGLLVRDSVIATIPVGYADGIDRHLGYGNLKVLINGHLCPTVGSICMDICMIDVTDVDDCRVGDRAEFFGDHVTPQSVADTLTTIPYEILTSVSPRVKRVYFRE